MSDRHAHFLKSLLVFPRLLPSPSTGEGLDGGATHSAEIDGHPHPAFILPHQGGGDRIPKSRIARVIFAAFLSVLTVGIETHADAEKIRTAIPQANLNYLSIYVADTRGFFKDEGLENETVVISGPLATAALLSGDVDFSGGGSGMRAALKARPVMPSPEGIKNFLEYDIKIPARPQRGHSSRAAAALAAGQGSQRGIGNRAKEN